MSDAVFQFFSGLPLEWVVFFSSAIPITELRAAIPFGIAMGLHPIQAFCFGVLGNLLPVPLILFLWPLIYRLFCRISFCRPWVESFVSKAQTKGKKVEKYGALGLMLFVGIPLPITGVWTGSLVAYLLGLNRLYSFLALGGGACIAGVVVTLASLGFIGLADTIGLAEVLGLIAILLLISYWIYRKRKGSRQKVNKDEADSKNRQ